MVRKKVKRWNDGDSGVFTDGTRFRLARVRAPERNQRDSSNATRIVAGMTSRSAGNVNWKPVGRSYGREVGEMSNRDGSVNNRMRNRGFKNRGR